MSGIIKQKLNWVNSELVDSSIKESDSISKDDAKKLIKALQKKQAVFLSEAQSLYEVAATSELYSVITISENIIRELEKLE
jgi:predicted ribosome-associated RNA-binding protein Tma20